MTVDITMPKLSRDARTLLVGMWRLRRWARRSVMFSSPVRLTPRARRVFDELVVAGILVMETLDRDDPQWGPRTYTPADDRAQKIGQHYHPIYGSGGNWLVLEDEWSRAIH